MSDAQNADCRFNKSDFYALALIARGINVLSYGVADDFDVLFVNKTLPSEKWRENSRSSGRYDRMHNALVCMLEIYMSFCAITRNWRLLAA